MYWDYILAFVGIAGFILAGRKVWWAWYIKQFGKEPPLTPLVKMMAEIYSDHPDLDPEWRTQ